MGISLILSRCSQDPGSPAPLAGNPDPSNFKIQEVRLIDAFVVVKVNYPDARNYEGNKILVFRATIPEVLGAKELDPHFCEHSHLSPIARFAPTEEGWQMAIEFCESQRRKR